jgi:hypothetical protein
MASKIRKQLLGSSTIEDVSPYLIAGSCGVDAAEPLRQLDKTGQVIDVAEVKPSPELRRLLDEDDDGA